jgi:hypothetical protein
MNVRLTSVVGALAVLFGLLVVFAQGLASGLTPEWALVLFVALLAILQAGRFAQSRRKTQLRETETADPEKRYDAPTPGDDIDAWLDVAGRWSRAGRTKRRQLRDRLAEVAARALMDEQGCSYDDAVRQIRQGTWTDDRVAAAFLSPEMTLSTGERARLLVRARSPLAQYRRALARTIVVIERLSLPDYGAADGSGSAGAAGTPEVGG